MLSIPSGSSLETIEQKLREKVLEKIEPSGKTGEEEFEEIKKQTREIYNALFLHTVTLIQAFRTKPKNAAETPDTDRLRQQAFSLLDEYQDNLVNFTMCLFKINRHMAAISEEIQEEETLLKIPRNAKKMEWTSDIEYSIRKRQKRKRLIGRENERFEKALKSLDAAYSHYESFDNALGEIATGEDKDKLSRSYTSSLRTLKFAKAERALREIQEYRKRFSIKSASQEAKKRAFNSGKKYIEAVMANQNDLLNKEEKLYIFPSELRSALASNKKEEEDIRKYLAKYHLHYMRGKLASLGRIREKLLSSIGTFERLTEIYFSLVKGLTETMVGFQPVREFESNTVERAGYLIENQFNEMETIEKNVDDLIEVYNRDQEVFNKGLKPEDFTGFDDVQDDVYI